MKVIMYTGENNYYDDSDFYYLVFDTETARISSITYASTRGHSNFDPKAEGLVFLDDLTEKDAICSAYSAELNKLSKVHATGGTYDQIRKGDVVKNNNPRARKFKGVKFEVTRVSDTTNRWGTTTFAYGAGDVKVNVDNLVIVEPSCSTLTYAKLDIIHRKVSLADLYAAQAATQTG